MTTQIAQSTVNQTLAATLLGVDGSTLSRWTGPRSEYEKEFSPQELLAIAEQHGIPAGVVGSRLLHQLRREAGAAAWREARLEVAEFMRGYRTRRRPTRTLTFEAFLEDLRLCLPPKVYGKVLEHVRADADEPADLESAPDETAVTR